MFEEFTDGVRKSTALANREAQRLQAACITPEHVLLALLELSEGGATIIINGLVDPSLVRRKLAERMKPQGAPSALDEMPAAATRKVIECAIEEAKALNHHWVGTEHILLALLHDDASIAAQSLNSCGIGSGDVRTRMVHWPGREGKS